MSGPKNTALDNFMRYNYTEGTSVVSKAVKRPCEEYKTLPKTVPEIKRALLGLKKRGLIIFGDEQIRKHLQGLIDSSQSDLNLIFGTWHKSPGQYTYINKLLFGQGDKTPSLKDITHIVLEMFGKGSSTTDKYLEFAQKYKEKCKEQCTQKAKEFIGDDLQYFIDFYQKYNSQGALKVLELYGKTYFKSSFPKETFENQFKTITLNKQYGKKYKLLASDISHNTEITLEKTYGNDSDFLVYDLREYLASSYALQEQDPSKKDVFVYTWGADHIDKYCIPRYIPQTDKVISIGLTGGGEQNPKILLEQAIKELGWGNQEFLVQFSEPGQTPYKEFDFLIHLPFKTNKDTEYSEDLFAVPYQIYTRPNTCIDTNK